MCSVHTTILPEHTAAKINLDDAQEYYQLSRARVVVECAFGRIKGRWRSLLKRSNVCVDFMSTVVTSCCILHNLCEVHKDGFDEQWLDEDVTRESIGTSSANTAQHSSSAVAFNWEH